MTKTKHTAGPWEIKEHRNAVLEIRETTSPDNDLIATIKGVAPGIAADIGANAALIAAAPELLEAALCALAALSQNKTFPADIALAKKTLNAAIAKARAKTSLAA